ncbi:MAG TPA: PAS domain-containing sensor histidine kinase [Rubricoccaceae bacterium]|nr:PAS domain-containing sensor histidine kinase [Rubricoccaceae bacterium]
MDDLLDTAPCGFFSVADDGTVLHANATLRALVGADDLVGRHLDAFLSPGARIFYQTHVFPLLRVEGRADEIYLSLRDRQGGDVPVLLNAVRRARGGRPVSDAVVVPMRRRNQFESELLQARQAAEEANRARARFLSMVSHDLRAPLGAINLASDLLASGAVGPVNDAQRHDLERIREASAYVLGLVADLLNFARVEANRADVRVRPVAVQAVLDRAVDVVEHLAVEARLTLAREGDDAGAAVLADPERLQQVLLNLLTNALKFTPAGGRVTLAAERAGGAVLLHVCDTGPGIPPEAAERIFDPFVQLEQSGGAALREGVGLGLAISRELARAMGGDLTVASVVGAGSTFTVRLPAATLPEEVAA